MTDEQINELGPALSTYVRTTSEHPFHVLGVGWVEAASLRPGDLLTCLGETPVAVEEVYDTEEHEAVYNVSISEAHTYFVGGHEWEWSLWAHNAACSPVDQLSQNEDQARKSLRRSMRGIGRDQEAHHVVPFELRNHPLVEYAARRGWQMNRGSSNGAALGSRTAPVVQHNGSHPRYTNHVENKLDEIVSRHGGLNDAAFAEFNRYTSRLRAALPSLSRRLD